MVAPPPATAPWKRQDLRHFDVVFTVEPIPGFNQGVRIDHFSLSDEQVESWQPLVDPWARDPERLDGDLRFSRRKVLAVREVSARLQPQIAEPDTVALAKAHAEALDRSQRVIFEQVLVLSGGIANIIDPISGRTMLARGHAKAFLRPGQLHSYCAELRWSRQYILAIVSDLSETLAEKAMDVIEKDLIRRTAAHPEQSEIVWEATQRALIGDWEPQFDFTVSPPQPGDDVHDLHNGEVA